MALWKGASPTIVRAVLMSSTTQATYSEIKQTLANISPKLFPADGISTMFAGTMVASFVANAVCTPFDVVKSRLQQQQQKQQEQTKSDLGSAMRPHAQPSELAGDGKVSSRSNGHSAFAPLIRDARREGFLRFFYRGFTPAFVKLAPYTTVSLLLVEKFTIWLTGKSPY